MKKTLAFLLAVSLLLSLTACQKASDPKPAQLSTNGAMVYDLTTHLMNGKYSSVIREYPFTREMELAITQNLLYSILFSLTQEKGKFLEIQEVLEEETSAGLVCYVNLAFRHGTAAFRYALNLDNQITGMTLVPYKEPSSLQQPLPKELPDGIREENVIIGSQFQLSGKLTLPKQATSAIVIFVPDATPLDMNGTHFQNKPYRDLSYDLAALGVASLRYDKRSFMYGEVVFTDRETTPYEDIIEDVLYALDYLRTHNVEFSDIYLAGHGLGGHLLPEIASYTDDVAGYIFLNANASSVPQLLQNQANTLLAACEGAQQDKAAEPRLLLAEVDKVLALDSSTPNDRPILGYYPTYWLWLQNYAPLDLVQSIDVPMLFLQGSRDYQNPSSELDLWWTALQTRTDARFFTLDTLNHLLMPGEGVPLPEEYQIPSHVAPTVSEHIADFISTSKIHPALQ